MNSELQEPHIFANRAFTHAGELGRSGRGSATPLEKQAADYVQAQLVSLGVQKIQTQTFSGERSLWLFVAMVMGLALVGHAAYWLLRQPVGVLPALVLSILLFGMSGYLVWVRFTLRGYPLSNILPQAPSQNVLANLPPAGEAQRKLVLIAHLDSHRAVFWFATDLLVSIFARISIITIYGIFLAIPVYILAAITGWPPFGWIGLVLAFFHFVGWFTGVTADLGRYSPGANDNAASVGTVLALAERLQGQPLHNTDIWLAFTGCEETSGGGIVAFIEQTDDQFKDAWFLDFEMVGIGDRLGYVRQEGNISRLTIPPDVESFLLEVGKPYELKPLEGPLVGASTECSILLKSGYKAVCLIAYRSSSTLMPEWHRLTDTPDRLEIPALERVHALAWDFIQRLDQ